jgi:hypothetical protein
MPLSEPPKAISVEVIATRPTPADRAAIDHLSAEAHRSLPHVTHLVKIRLATIPKAESRGWFLFLGDFRIPKYWQYLYGIYFKLFDPQFLHDHEGKPLRFSPDETEFIDTGLKLPASHHVDPSSLPHQEEVLRR